MVATNNEKTNIMSNLFTFVAKTSEEDVGCTQNCMYVLHVCDVARDVTHPYHRRRP